MKTTIVTSFSNGGFYEYAFRFFETFEKFWPADTTLVAYYEAPKVIPRAEMRDLYAVEAMRSFLDRHSANQAARGRVPNKTWKPKDRADGYSFRSDAVKFCRKVFAVADAARQISEGILVWIDADVVTTAPVPADFIGEMLARSDVAYLGRDGVHSECGFLAFRLPEALPLILEWERLYMTDEVFLLPEQHDSFVFDYARGQLPKLHYRNLTPGGSRHVWCDSPLAAYTDHCKGERKKLGFSPERKQ